MTAAVLLPAVTACSHPPPPAAPARYAARCQMRQEPSGTFMPQVTIRNTGSRPLAVWAVTVTVGRTADPSQDGTLEWVRPGRTASFTAGITGWPRRGRCQVTSINQE